VMDEDRAEGQYDAGPVLVIDLNPKWSECAVCGEWTPARWGIPVRDGIVIASEDLGEWVGMPACHSHYAMHQRGELIGFDLWFK
jgi:hypothetical protein